MFYFAYGSNLNSFQMKTRCPESKKIGAGELKGYQLLFRSHNGTNGYLTIERDEKSFVPIGVYEISENDMKNLDRYEGVKYNLYRKEEIEIKNNQVNIKGLVYIMNEGIPLLPENDYYKKVMQGYADFNFDPNILISAYNECKQRLFDYEE